MSFQKIGCKILILLLILISNLGSTLIKNNFIPITEGSYEYITEYYPDLDIYQIYSMDGTRLKNVSPNIQINQENSLNIAGTDPIRNIIIYSVGEIDFDIYGDETGDIQFSNPHGIKIDEDGSVFVADTGNNRIVKLYYDAEFIKYDTSKGCTTWGEFGNGETQFNNPYGLCIDNDYVFVADRNNHRILKFDKNGNPINSFNGRNWFGEYGIEEDKLYYPVDVEINNRKEFIVCQKEKISLFNSYGKFIKTIHISDIGYNNADLRCVAVDKFDNIYTVDYINNKVYKFDDNLNFLTSMGESNNSYYTFDYPNSIFIYKKYGLLGISVYKGFKLFFIGPGIEIISTKPSVFSPFDINNKKVEIKYKLTSESLITALVTAPNNQLIRKIEENIFHETGTNILVWDGKSDMGQEVAEWDYTIKIIARGIYDAPYAAEVSTTASVVHPAVIEFKSVTPDTIDNENNNCTLRYSIPKVSYVNMNIVKSNNNGIEIIKRLLIDSQQNKGDNYIQWDGRDNNGNIVPDGIYYFAGKTLTFDNQESDWQYQIVGVDRVPIRIEYVDMPYSFAPKKGNVKIEFRLNEPGFVTAKIFTKSGNFVKTVVENKFYELQTTNYELYWDGKESDGDWADEGEYYVEITAVDVTGNSRDVAY